MGMRISGYVLILIAVALIFAMYGSIVSDFEKEYPDIPINKSSWEGKYDFTSGIMSNNSILAKEIKAMSDPDTGFLTKTIAGVFMIPTFVVTASIFVIGSIVNSHFIISGILGDILGISDGIVFMILVGFDVCLIFAIVSLMQRSPA
jgi:hypothetical protein